MADDKNKGLSPEEIEFQEQIAEETTPESMTRALRRRTSMLGSANTRERQRRLDLEKHQQMVNDVDARYSRAISGTPLPTDDISADSLKRDQDVKRHHQSKIGEMQQEFSAGGYWENYRKERAAADLVKSTNTFVGKRSTDEQIYRASKSVSSLGVITKEASGKTSTQLEKDVAAEKARLAEQQEEIRTMAATGLHSPADEEAYRQAGIHHQESVNKLGALTGAQTRQGRNKTDLMGRQRSTESLVAKVGKDSLKREVASEIASGNVGSMEEEGLNLESIQDKILKAAEAFEKALDGSGDAAEELGKELEDLGEEYDKQKEKMGQMASGGGESIKDKVARWSGTAADVLQAGATGLKTMGVDQELRDVANRTGFAAISNQQFQDHQAALGGDMAAFRRMNSDQYGKSADKAGFLGNLTATSVGLSAGADAAAIAGVIAKNAGNASSWIANQGDALSETISVGAQRGVSSVSKITDVARGLSSGETQRQAFHAYMALSDEEKRVQDASMQAYRDTMGGNTLATRGAGSGRSALFGQMDDPAQRMALAKLGMGADQMQATYGQGINEMGADFRGAGAAGMVKRAAELQRSGMMNAGDYMSNMGQLNAVGGGAGNMETIMKNAVANGMDSSRNIQQMVAGIAGLSSASAMMGISTAAGATNAMGLALDTEALRSLPAEMRAGAAASQIGKMGNSMSDSSMNLFNVAESFALRKAFPEASDAQLARMQKLRPEEIAEIQADPTAAKKFGLDVVNKTKDGVNKLSRISAKTEANSQAGLLVGAEARAGLNDVIDGKMTWKEFEKQHPQSSQDVIAAGGLHGSNSAVSMPFLAKLAAGEKMSASELPPDSGKPNAAEGILAAQFTAMEKLNAAGQKHFKDLYDGIEGFNKKLERSLKDFDPEGYEGQAGKAAQGSLQVKGFDGSVSNFSKAVDAFVKGVTDKITSVSDQGTRTPEEVMQGKRDTLKSAPEMTPKMTPEIEDWLKGGN